MISRNTRKVNNLSVFFIDFSKILYNLHQKHANQRLLGDEKEAKKAHDRTRLKSEQKESHRKAANFGFEMTFSFPIE